MGVTIAFSPLLFSGEPQYEEGVCAKVDRVPWFFGVSPSTEDPEKTRFSSMN